MALVLAQIVFPYDTGLPGDVSVNTLHFDMAVANSSTADLTSAAIEDFFTANTQTPTNTVDDYFSSKLTTNATIRYYNLGDPLPRVPFAIDAFSVAPSAVTTPLPEEVAVVFSFHSQIDSGDVAARRRNRMFVGPLNEGTIDSGETFVRVNAGFSECLAEVGQNLKAASQAAAGVWAWHVWSPTDQISEPVVGGWIDNSFDIQRRRGPAATARILWA